MRAAVCLALACALLSACGTPSDDTVHDNFPALGTLVEVSLRDVPGNQQAVAFRVVRDAMRNAGEDWYGWGGGELGRYNLALSAGEHAEASPRLEALLTHATALQSASSGLFDPSIGALTELWGFHEPDRATGPPPEGADINAWLSGHMPMRMDFGAYAKGVAVADVISTLSEMGVRHALVNAGGDIAVIGTAAGRPWRVGIRNPRGNGVLAGIHLEHGEAIFTSGDYERAFEWDGEWYHHILDPRTGRPATGTASITVIHEDAAVADAASTALFVAGDDWPAIADTMGITFVMRVRNDGAIEGSPTMAARVTFESEVDSMRVRSHVASAR